MTDYWPWFVAFAWLIGYEVYSVVTHQPTLSQLVWRGTRAWSPLPYVVWFVLWLLILHFWFGLWGPVNLFS